MVRSISPLALTTITTKVGIEPINILAIDWSGTGTLFYYSDRLAPEEPGLGGKILAINNLDSVTDIVGSTTNLSVNITLDDTTGELKNIFNNTDIHKKPVAILQWFSGIPLSDAFIIAEGQIASPIVYKEGDRTLTFDIISRLTSNEVGFAPSDGSFTNVAQELADAVWPLPFGTVLNLKPVLIDLIPSGATLIPLGVTDAGLTQAGTTLNCNISKQLAISACLSKVGAKLQFEGDLGGGGREIFDKGTQFQQRALDILRQVATQTAKDRGRVGGIQAQQQGFDPRSFTVINGHRFLQGVTITIRVGKIVYTGVMNGDNFSVINRRIVNEPFAGTPPGAPVTDFGGGGGSGGQAITIEDPISQFLEDALFGNTDPDSYITSTKQERKEDPCGPHNLILPACGNGSSSTKSGAAFFGQASASGHIFEQAGSSVTVWDNYPVRYVVSILPGTVVLSVAAFIHDGGVKRLVTVPPVFYSISTVDYGGGIVATIITVRAPLSQIDMSMLASQEAPPPNLFTPNTTLTGALSTVSFEDDLYVTVQSPIGPNIADILQYLIQTYAPNLAIDAASFAEAHTDLIPYPANFALLTKKNLIDVLKEIAFQGMCALWISNNTFFIKFLPKQHTLVETFTENDVEAKTLEVTSEPTEHLVTKFVAEWKQDYSLTQNNKLILKANVAKYGIIEQHYDFYIYNNESSVKVASTFWLIRRANTFKILKFKTFLHKLRVESLDDVSLNFANNYVANTNVPGVVQTASFNSADKSIDMQIWVPVRFGEMVLYNNALPVTYEDVYPSKIDELAGNAGSLPPSSLAKGNLGGSNGSTFNVVRTNQSKGATRPADPGFVAPTPGSVVNAAGPANAGGLRNYSPIGGPASDYKGSLPSAPVNLPRPKITGNNAVFPGRVLSFDSMNDQGDQVYLVRAFPAGFTGDFTDIKVAQLQLDDQDTIPKDTWVEVTQLTVITDKGQGSVPDVTIEYSMMIPVWLPDNP